MLAHLEQVEVSYDHPYDVPARFPVQWVVRTGGSDGEYRGYAGQLASGALRAGEEVVVLPSGQRTRIAAIDTFEGELDEAIAPLSLTLRLEDDLDVARGELIAGLTSRRWSRASSRPTSAGWTASRCARAAVHDQAHLAARPRSSRAVDRVNVHARARAPPAELALNDIARVQLRTSAPLAIDPYAHNRRTGSFVLIDEATRTHRRRGHDRRRARRGPPYPPSSAPSRPAPSRDGAVRRSGVRTVDARGARP